MPTSEAHNLRQVKIHLAAVQKLIDSAHEHGSSAASGALQRTGLADGALQEAFNVLKSDVTALEHRSKDTKELRQQLDEMKRERDQAARDYYVAVAPSMLVSLLGAISNYYHPKLLNLAKAAPPTAEQIGALTETDPPMLNENTCSSVVNFETVAEG